MKFNESLANISAANDRSEPREMKDGLFVSAEALERVKAIFFEAAKVAPGSRNAFILTKLEVASLKDSSSFDDYYYFLYLLHMSAEQSRPVVAAPRPGLSRLRIVKALLDLESPRYNNDMTFEESLLDENFVAEIRGFAHLIKRLIPYPTYVERLGLGCVWLEFGVYGDADLDREGDLPMLSKNIVEAAASNTEHKLWRTVKTRYSALLELRPS